VYRNGAASTFIPWTYVKPNWDVSSRWSRTNTQWEGTNGHKPGLVSTIVSPDKCIQKADEHVFTNTFFEPFVCRQCPMSSKKWVLLWKAWCNLTEKYRFWSSRVLHKALGRRNEETYRLRDQSLEVVFSRSWDVMWDPYNIMSQMRLLDNDITHHRRRDPINKDQSS